MDSKDKKINEALEQLVNEISPLEDHDDIEIFNAMDEDVTRDEIEVIKINFLKDLTKNWMKYEDKKKKDRRRIGYSLLFIILAQIIFILCLVFNIQKLNISDTVFTVTVTGMFAEMVGLFYIVVSNMFRDDGDQGLKSIVDLLQQKEK